MSQVVRRGLISAKGFVPLVAMLILWEWLGRDSVNFPPPSSSFASAAALSSAGVLTPAILATLSTILGGLIGACLLGFVLGLIVGTVQPIRRWSSLVLEFLRALPPPIVIPIAVLFVGYSRSMEVGVVTVAASWPVLLNTVAAVDNINPALIDIARSFRLSKIDQIGKIIIPSVLPSAITGVRVAIPLAIVLTLLVEMLTGLPGVGVLMIQGQRNFNSSQVFGVLGVVAILGYALHLAYIVGERAFLKNRPGVF